MATASLHQLVRQLQHSAKATGLGELPDQDLLDRLLVGDTSAFEALVWRHGSLVLSACRRVLSDEADAEDAFQATFLALLQGARSIRRRNAVGAWLCGVAHRIAVDALADTLRRRQRERRAARTEAAPPAPDLSWREACAALHRELDRLPDKYRLPLVLCYLRGLSRDEAARQLGWTTGAIKGRLERGRRLLRDRLARRGITLSAGLLAALGDSAAARTVPSRLVQATLYAAMSGQRSAAVAALIGGATRAMSPKVSLAAGLLVIAGLLVAGVTLWPPPSAALPSDPPRVPAKADKSELPHSITCSGRVLTPDGKPAAGARVSLHVWSRKSVHWPALAISGEEGAFSFTFKPSERGVIDPSAFAFTVLATADGFGPGWDWLRGEADGLATRIGLGAGINAGWTWLDGLDKATGLTLRLVKEVPIQGRLLDINGKPVVGAQLRVKDIDAYPDIEGFLQTVREGESPPLPRRWWEGPLPGQPKTLTTGTDGRFKLVGVGADRLVRFQVEGPGIQYGPIHVLTRDLKARVEPKVKDRFSNIQPVYGATFDYVAAPSRTIRGGVRDQKTGKPLAGVEISGSTTRTDKDGRYELLGSPKSAMGYFLTFLPAESQPYFPFHQFLPDTPGLDPIRADVGLPAGLVVKGRVTHAKTGQPVKDAEVSYFPLYPNPAVRVLGASFQWRASWATTAADGTYRLVVLPGPGVLGFSAYSPKEAFLPAVVTAQELKDFFKDNANHGDENRLLIEGAGGGHLMDQDGFHHLLLIRPGEKDETLLRDVVLQPGLAVKGKLVGPDGKPLAGALAYGLTQELDRPHKPLAGDTFTVQGVNPRRTRQLVFLHREKRLGAFVALKGEKKEPLTVRLEACATIAGRLVDEDGRPLVNVGVRAQCLIRLREFNEAGPLTRTGKDGGFRLDGLVPGQRYNVHLSRGGFGPILFGPGLVKPGENKDLGAIKIKPSNADD